MNKNTIFISILPEMAKTFILANFSNSKYTIVNLCFSEYTWGNTKYDPSSKGIGYVDDTVECAISHNNSVDIIFVPLNKEIRKSLTDKGIEYYTVYPALDMKDHILFRMIRQNYSDIDINNIREDYESISLDVDTEWMHILDGYIIRKDELSISSKLFRYCQLNKDNLYLTMEQVESFIDGTYELNNIKLGISKFRQRILNTKG